MAGMANLVVWSALSMVYCWFGFADNEGRKREEAEEEGRMRERPRREHQQQGSGGAPAGKGGRAYAMSFLPANYLSSDGADSAVWGWPSAKAKAATRLRQLPSRGRDLRMTANHSALILA